MRARPDDVSRLFEHPSEPPEMTRIVVCHSLGGLLDLQFALLHQSHDLLGNVLDLDLGTGLLKRFLQSRVASRASSNDLLDTERLQLLDVLSREFIERIRLAHPQQCGATAQLVLSHDCELDACFLEQLRTRGEPFVQLLRDGRGAPGEEQNVLLSGRGLWQVEPPCPPIPGAPWLEPRIAVVPAKE